MFQVQALVVENYLATSFKFTFQNEFRDTFSDSPVPKFESTWYGKLCPWHKNSSSSQSNKHDENSKQVLDISDTSYNIVVCFEI
jgi:hypothetical protein